MGRHAWTAAAVVATVTAAAALRRPPDIRLSDLSVYVGAVGGLADGASLYDFTRGAAPFTYPPFAGVLFGPLTWLPLPPVQFLWTLATVATVAGLAVLVKRDRAGPLALALFLSAPISSDLRYGQVSLFLAGFIAVDVLALRRTPWFGSLIGIAAAIKLTPLIFIPMLWLAGRRRAAVTAAATFAGCAVIAAMVLPGDSWRFWTTEVFQVSRLGHIMSAGNQSLNGMLLRLAVPESARSVLVLTIGGAVAAIALWRAGRLARHGDWLSALVVVGAASIVLSPVSWTHHQVWLVLAVLLPVRGPAWARYAWVTLVLAVMLLPVTALGGPVWTNSRLLLAVVVATGAGVVAVRRDRPTTPTAAITAAPRASTAPSVPDRKPSPRTSTPIVAATAGLATLTIASGAASPPPRYDA
jgi:alpha-1,2-mannosyltransferase